MVSWLRTFFLLSHRWARGISPRLVLVPPHFHFRQATDGVSVSWAPRTTCPPIPFSLCLLLSFSLAPVRSPQARVGRPGRTARPRHPIGWPWDTCVVAQADKEAGSCHWHAKREAIGRAHEVGEREAARRAHATPVRHARPGSVWVPFSPECSGGGRADVWSLRMGWARRFFSFFLRHASRAGSCRTERGAEEGR